VSKQRKKTADPSVEIKPTLSPEQIAASLDKYFDNLERDEILRYARKREHMKKAAQYRWQIAQRIHRLDTGEPLNFEEYPYQKDIYQDDAPEIVVMGSVQWGKTEFLVCSAFAMAGMGLKVFFVCSSLEKRNKFVKDRIDPALTTVPAYIALREQAERDGRLSDGVGLKHFGYGSINLVGSNSKREFTSYRADVAITDEHQDCEQDNLARVDSRLSGSPWQFKIIVGNPRTIGTEENQNLDWQYKQSDQRQWQIPCPRCKELQTLDWLAHFVRQQTNKGGGILSVTPRDEDWDPKGKLDMRPICQFCESPMNRLSKEGLWVPMNPGHPRHGYQLSNLHNCNVRAAWLFEKYLMAKSSASRLADFWNDQLGKAWNFDGTNITEAMMANCASGDSGIAPYQFTAGNMLRLQEVA
jgi:phage terminase large subunit GpA-like protein